MSDYLSSTVEIQIGNGAVTGFVQCLDLDTEELASRVVDEIDISFDEVAPRHYKENEDPKFFKSKTTNRGPLIEGWRQTQDPIM